VQPDWPVYALLIADVARIRSDDPTRKVGLEWYEQGELERARG
jgi:deoxycytidylate deaminase